MATQQSFARAVPPSGQVTVWPAPVCPASTGARPAAGRLAVDIEVPVIKPYLVGSYGGGGIASVTVDSVRALASAPHSAVGDLIPVHRWRSTPAMPGAASGQAAARIAVKSGGAVVAAQFTGASASSGAVNAGLREFSWGGTGTAAAALGVIATAEAVFGGEGKYSGLTPVDAPLGSGGALSAAAAAAGSVITAGAASSSGQLTALSGQPVRTSGSGALQVLTGSPAPVGGDGVLSSSYGVSAQAPMTLAGAGALTAAAVPSFRPVSMTKQGLWNGMSSTFKDVTGWVADVAGYPGSALSGNGLVVQSAKTNATVAASIVMQSQQFGGVNVTLQLMINNVPSVTGTATNVPSNGAATVTVSGLRNVVAGDVITVQAKGDGIFYPTADTNTASYVRVS